jgi:RNA polymerase sigma factor (sigma-70 family)
MPSGLENEATLPQTAERDDAELLSAYVRGDEQAFESVVKRYFGLVYAIALRRLGNPSWAEEATQSTFIILARKARTLSNGLLLRPWLLKTARFICNDVLKSQRRRQQHEEPMEADLAELPESNGDRDGGQARELVEQALLSLPTTEQACLVARFYEGRTFKEVGHVLGLTEDAAQKKVSRSLEKLRLYLSKRGIKMSDAVLSGCLWGYQVSPVPPELVDSSMRAMLAATHGKISSGSAVALAERCLRLLACRQWLMLSARVVPLLLVLAGAGWFSSSWFSSRVGPNDPQIEALGKAWSVVVLRAAAAKQTYKQAPAPNTPEFQAYMNDIQFVINETARISPQVEAALKPAKDRQQMAQFLTVEMRETLGLDRAQQKRIFDYLREGLSRGATLREAMKVMGQTTSAEAGEIKALLPAKQRQVFDRVYGADGLCLLQYCKLDPG